MKESWDQRYSLPEYIYGKSPNEFFRSNLDAIKPGTLFLPAEGEGRNAVYAARKAWNVYALDFSEAAKRKAIDWANENGVHINYEVADLTTWNDAISADVVALIFAHFGPEWRERLHKKMAAMLKSGGTLILESYSKDQLSFNSGGPKDWEMLYSANQLRNDFSELRIELLQEEIIELNEGRLHSGLASVIRMIAKKTT
jgi:hypothetical protein